MLNRKGLNRNLMPFYPSEANNLSRWQAAYLGALVDGEGWISFTANKYPLFGVTNSNRDLIQLVADMCGVGSIYSVGATGLGTKPMYRWQTTNQEDFLKLGLEIYPYLIEKRDKMWRGLSVASLPNQNFVRHEAAREKIEKAIASLQEEGKPVTPWYVYKLTGCSVNTVRKYLC